MKVPEGPGVTQSAIEAPPPDPVAFTPPPRSPAGIGAGRLTNSTPNEGVGDLLNNRFILGGLGLVAVLLLTAIVLVAIGNGDEGGSGSPNAIAPSENETPARPLGGLAGTTTAAVSYRNGPAPTHVILGTIPGGVTVAIVGRSEDSTWLQVRYPADSTLRGWVDAKLLDVNGDVSVLLIAGPGPVASAGVTPLPTVGFYEPMETPGGEVAVPPTRVSRPTSAAATRRPTVTPYRTPFPTPEATPEEPSTRTVPAPPLGRKDSPET